MPIYLWLFSNFQLYIAFYLEQGIYVFEEYFFLNNKNDKYILVVLSFNHVIMKKNLISLTIISLSLLVLVWCSAKNSIHVGDMVSIEYIATFPDGQIFEQYNDQTPLIFTVGSWQVIPWLDQGIIGTKVGSTKTITVKPTKWYGQLYDKNKIQKISQLIFDKLSIKPEKWTLQKLGDIEGIITWTETDSNGNVLVLFDINPRQTRDTLKYKVTILSKK